MFQQWSLSRSILLPRFYLIDLISDFFCLCAIFVPGKIRGAHVPPGHPPPKSASDWIKNILNVFTASSWMDVNFKSNQIKAIYSFIRFYKFWYILIQIKWLNIYKWKSCMGRRLVRKPYISQDHKTQRKKTNLTKVNKNYINV